ncbi:MAG: hypothetical protein U0L05_06190 [Schaedlerella sp.]|nr:hypothetical protein [Schaedlerella sp.]
MCLVAYGNPKVEAEISGEDFTAKEALVLTVVTAASSAVGLWINKYGE